jgi:hypothetical protein
MSEESIKKFEEEMKAGQIRRTGEEYYFYKEFKKHYNPDIQLFRSPQDVHNVISEIFWLDKEGMENDYIDVLKDLADDNRKSLAASDAMVGACYYNVLNLIASVQLLVEERDLLKKKLEAS